MANSRCFDGQIYNSSVLSSAFLRGLAFGKSVSAFEGNAAIMSIKNEKDIFLAVKKAYIDMSPRTFEKIKGWWIDQTNVKVTKSGKTKDERLKNVEDNWQKEKNIVFAWLSNEFYKYFQGNHDNFNKWHERICDEFLKKFRPILTKYGYNAEKSLKFGKAQKIVNMTFKYLFCFDDAEEYSSKFDKCHMTLDGYILKWYNDMSENKCSTPWSDLDKGAYYKLQKEIKELLNGNNPFLSEFYIWDEYNK